VVIYYRIEIKEYVINFIYSNIYIYRIIADYELSLFWSYVSISYISSRDFENSFIDGAKTIKNVTVSHDLSSVGSFIGSNDKYFSKNKFIGSDIIDYWSTTIRIHIKSGALDEVFLELADFHRTRNEERIKIISKLSEPVAMLVIGGIIGVIAIAILSPFYEITQGISSL
jgi:type II secretory pathway component PulF